MKKVLGLSLIIIFNSCSKSRVNNESINSIPPDEDPLATENSSPESPTLIYPSKDLLCLDSNLIFEWSTAIDPDDDPVSYTIQIAANRTFNDILEDRTSEVNSISLSLPRGQAFYWRVLAKDGGGKASTFSDVFAFYVEGDATSNHVPFSARPINPKDSTQISDINVSLKWGVSDLDGDVLSYDLFFGKEENPDLLIEGLEVETYELTVEANTAYYWRIDTSDGRSKSIGDVWYFRTN